MLPVVMFDQALFVPSRSNGGLHSHFGCDRTIDGQNSLGESKRASGLTRLRQAAAFFLALAVVMLVFEDLFTLTILLA